MGKILLNQIYVQGGSISYDFSASDEIQIYFNKNCPFTVEYDEDLSDVPYAILVIPFLTNILPIAWLTDSEIMIDSVDKAFYESIPNFKKGYRDMYQNVSFKGKLTVKSIADCSYEHSGRTASFFSSGVDSYCTLIRNISKKPELITIWGSDIKIDDTDGWHKVKTATLEAANTFGLKTTFIKSSFRLFLNCDALDKQFSSILNNNWWGGIHHGIGIIGHAAPYAWKNRISVQYIAATLSFIDKNVQWASYPTIDSEVKFGSCDVCHDSFDYTRQDKINEIASFHKNTGLPVNLRVCWESSGGNNCCRCEKCYRTIMGILVSGHDPNDFNFYFDFNADNFNNIKNLVVWGRKMNISHRYWDPIKSAAIQNKDQLKKLWYYKYIKWIYSIDFSDIEHNAIRRRYEFVTSMKVILLRFVPKPLYNILKK